jgi:hypothetical protein
LPKLWRSLVEIFQREVIITNYTIVTKAAGDEVLANNKQCHDVSDGWENRTRVRAAGGRNISVLLHRGRDGRTLSTFHVSARQCGLTKKRFVTCTVCTRGEAMNRVCGSCRLSNQSVRKYASTDQRSAHLSSCTPTEELEGDAVGGTISDCDTLRETRVKHFQGDVNL